MNNATTNHPDFTNTLTSIQIMWCEANDIQVRKGDSYGFDFSKGSRWIEPIKATATRVYLFEADQSEDGDGAKLVASYPRLKAALAALRG
jgi:hypothetical protein